MSSSSSSSPPLPPEHNPVLSAYESFVRDTPLVTRYALTGLTASYVLSYFVDTSRALSNAILPSLMRFELYRIVLSPLVCNSALTLVFAYLSFVDQGKRLEYSMGSASFAVFLLTLGVVTNLAFLVLMGMLYGLSGGGDDGGGNGFDGGGENMRVAGSVPGSVPGSGSGWEGGGNRSYLVYPCYGAWTVLLGVIAAECSSAPPGSRRRIFAYEMDVRYYPLAVLGFFSLLGGVRWGECIGVGVGYMYGLGYLDRIKIGSARCRSWEEDDGGPLRNFAGRPGWVVCTSATGMDAWMPLNVPGGVRSERRWDNQGGSGGWSPAAFFRGTRTDVRGGDAGGGGRTMASALPRPGRVDPPKEAASAASAASAAFGGSGQSLGGGGGGGGNGSRGGAGGGASRRPGASAEERHNAMLEAAERRAAKAKAKLSESEAKQGR